MQEKKKYSMKRRIYVWWYYHWKLLFIILASLTLLTAVLISQFGKKKPDYQISIVSSSELPVDTQEALIRELKAYCEDVNHDGHILLQLNSYRADFGDAVIDNDAYDQMSGIIKLYTDIQSDDGSYIYLIRDPEGFEDTTRILQYLDGTVPANEEESVNVWDMCYKWSDCPVLTALPLGSYKGLTLVDNEIGESQNLLADFYIGRRILNTDTQKQNHEKDEILWKKLTDGAATAAGKEPQP